MVGDFSVRGSVMPLTFSSLRHLGWWLHIVWLGVCGVGWVSGVHAHPAASREGFTFEVEAAGPVGETMELFYDVGQWYNQRHVVRAQYTSEQDLKTYRLELPARPIKHLRFDPLVGKGVIRIAHMRLRDASGVILAEFGPEWLVPMQAIESIRVRDGVGEIKVNADDPMILVSRTLHELTIKALGRRTLTLGDIASVATLCFGLFAFVCVYALKIGTQCRNDSSVTRSHCGRQRGLWLTAVFFTVLERGCIG